MNLDTAARPKSGTQWTIEADGHRAVVVEVGGNLRHYSVGGRDVVDGFAEDEIAPAMAGAILAPWPSRIRDGQYTFRDTAHQLPLTEAASRTALHGLVLWGRWTLVEHAADTVTVEYDLPPMPGYPWSLVIRSTWTVGADGLRAVHTATNTDTEACPFGFSVHPYLRLPGVAVDDAELTVPARSRVLFDGRLLPIGAVKVAGTDYDYAEPRRIGAAVLDTTFGDVVAGPDGGSAVTLAAPGGPSLDVWADGQFSYWQVFSADTLGGERRRRSVAIEPMTCPPDAFRSGRDLIVLEPGQTWTGTWGIRPSL
ncbi:aldose 1-epimerase family protein [Spirilliplanes yamanashiensis]|uniref:Aldose 1-epimerase n=1 Tax=Spirilliplanes yamanashiensis TaxID=42233 RepID=A0A8J3Y9D8_9ACTN|nr:aldose 1-epimerase family protein [Spirilliplanes yamanashiensis]MDP9815548.1 aldose 1-epimerase [Spirilliplanes yamanashiensis]GIJ03802.1 aldose 1-epimerase [Spirilliplanes yamanashiensis]